MASLSRSFKFFAAGVAVASIPAYYQLHQDLFRTQRLVDDSVNRLRKTVVAQTQDLQKKVLALETQLAEQNGRQQSMSLSKKEAVAPAGAKAAAEAKKAEEKVAAEAAAHEAAAVKEAVAKVAVAVAKVAVAKVAHEAEVVQLT